MSLSLRQIEIGLNGEEGCIPMIRPFDLDIGAGEIVTLMGPSGSGKSTILSAIAGSLGAPFKHKGTVLLAGENVTPLPANRRRMGRLFQDDLLFPHLTLGENLLFGLPRGAKAARLQKMQEALTAVELGDMQDRPPHTLSGGQRQRVALMRSLLAEPRAMLLDEPFGKLDENLRKAMRELTFAMLRERATPTLLVTHDRADVPQGGRLFEIDKGQVKHVG